MRWVRGWLIGDFDPSVLKTKDVEVALQSYNTGDHEERHYHSLAFSFSIAILFNSRAYNSVRASMINHSDITFVVQGGIDPSLTPLALQSIREYCPESKIVVSTWENSSISSLDDSQFSLVVSKDPGNAPRGEDPDSKPNNINRQIVSTYAGLRLVTTDYVVKFRSDFILNNTSFLRYFGRLNKFNSDYQIFSDRLLVCMFGTRKPIGEHYSLPYHVSDFTVFGKTSDVKKLYDIPLVTDDEFNYFRINPEIPRSTYAVNQYNAEQSIIINCLRAQGKIINCRFSTDVSNEISVESDKYLVNNFYPISFNKFGILPLKDHLLPRNNMEKYSDYYTEVEWLKLYKRYVDEEFNLPVLDQERLIINAYNKTFFISKGLCRVLLRFITRMKSYFRKCFVESQ
jgi:hypothetical protein